MVDIDSRLVYSSGVTCHSATYKAAIVNIDRIVKNYMPMTETAFYILLSLYEPRHGYGIIRTVEEITKSRIILGSGTVYGTLTKMQRDGIIAVYSNEEHKTVYEITESGRKLLKLEIERLNELHRNADELGVRFFGTQIL